MPWTEVGDTDIYYTEAGTGRPLVLLHGRSSCGEAWFQQFEAFAPYFRVIAYDSVNHGHSANSPRDAPEPDRADELEGFLQALGLERPIIAGNSMGALTTIRWAVRHPNDAVALIPSGMGIGEVAGGMAQPDPIDDQTLFLPIGDSLTDNCDPALYDRYLRIRSTATRLEAMRHPRTRTMTNPTWEELDEAVEKIQSPMLVVVGALDRFVPNARALADAVPGAGFCEIANSPHNVYYETAAEYNRAVSAFLAGHDLMPAR